MSIKQKPKPEVVKVAAKDLPKKQSAIAKPTKKPTTLVKEMEGRTLADQKNAPDPHKPPKKPRGK